LRGAQDVFAFDFDVSRCQGDLRLYAQTDPCIRRAEAWRPEIQHQGCEVGAGAVDDGIHNKAVSLRLHVALNALNVPLAKTNNLQQFCIWVIRRMGWHDETE
jgi:hypothetical protein